MADDDARKKNANFLLILLAIPVIFTFLVVEEEMRVNSKPSTPTKTASAPAETASVREPEEACRVEAETPAARMAAQKWCGGGVFTLVQVTSDAANFVAHFELSQKSERTWNGLKPKMLAQFRGVVDEMAGKAGVNVAFSVHDTSGEMVGGCFRRRREARTTCN